MAFVAPLLGILGAAAGVATAVQSMTQSKKASKEQPQPGPLPTTPTESAAKTDAAAELKKRRQASFLSGGLTNLTRGAALVPEANIGRKSLLGE